MAFFIHSPKLNFVSFTLFLSLCYSLKIKNYEITKKKIFCIYGCFSVSRYIKGDRKNLIFRTIVFLDKHVYANNPCFFFDFFSIRVFFHNHSRITGLQEKGEGISLTPHYHFHPFHRHLDISRVITAESSPLHVGSSRTRTGNLWFPSASR